MIGLAEIAVNCIINDNFAEITIKGRFSPREMSSWVQIPRSHSAGLFEVVFYPHNILLISVSQASAIPVVFKLFLANRCVLLVVDY